MSAGRRRGRTRWFPIVAWGLCDCNGNGYKVDLNDTRYVCDRCRGAGAPHRIRKVSS